MRVVALLAVWNEERFLAGCLDHLVGQGVDAYLIDNESTDRTLEIAERYRGRGVIGVETRERRGVYSWLPLLERKAQLGAELDADWFVHVDPDEIRLPPTPRTTLVRALEEVDRAGYNAVDFQEFTFVPTRESPDHDHPRFAETMRWYYPFLPRPHNRLNAWKRQEAPVDLSSSGGHQVAFTGLRPYPQSFPMRHYLFLSVAHALEKYVDRTYDPVEVRRGFHRARAALRPSDIRLPATSELREYIGDDRLDAREPLRHHLVLRGAT